MCRVLSRYELTVRLPRAHLVGLRLHRCAISHLIHGLLGADLRGSSADGAFSTREPSSCGILPTEAKGQAKRNRDRSHDSSKQLIEE